MFVIQHVNEEKCMMIIIVLKKEKAATWAINIRTSTECTKPHISSHVHRYEV